MLVVPVVICLSSLSASFPGVWGRSVFGIQQIKMRPQSRSSGQLGFLRRVGVLELIQAQEWNRRCSQLAVQTLFGRKPIATAIKRICDAPPSDQPRHLLDNPRPIAQLRESESRACLGCRRYCT